MMTYLQRIRGYLTRINIDDFPFDLWLILFLPIFMTYSVALSIPPVHDDILKVLLLVSRVDNPLEFFTLQSSMWVTQTYYRPFFLLTFWLPYRLVGVSWFPNQAFNLLLHLLNAYLILRILQKHRVGREAALLVSLLYGISIYTSLTVTWTVARTGLLVGTFLVLALHHYAMRMDSDRPVNALYLAILSVLAVLSKESGLIVPALVVFASIDLWPLRINNLKTLLAALAIIIAYFILRLALFGSLANSFSGYEVSPILLLGGQDYYALPPTLQNSVIARAEVIAKNILAIFIPIFNNQGTFFGLKDTLLRLPLLITPVLVMLALGKRLTRFQQFGLFVILANGVLHFPFFSHYLMYLGHIGLCIFIGASPQLVDRLSPIYKSFVALCVVLIFANAFLVSRSIHRQLITYNDWLQGIAESRETWSDLPIAGILDDIVERYGD
jgi:hypothetical protein